jgi:hypothetical protein
MWAELRETNKEGGGSHDYLVAFTTPEPKEPKKKSFLEPIIPAAVGGGSSKEPWSGSQGVSLAGMGPDIWGSKAYAISVPFKETRTKQGAKVNFYLQ